MPDSAESWSARVVPSIDDIPAKDWDACARHDNPFVSHTFLSILEASGSATAETGWQPSHIVLNDTAGRVVGVAPSYLKSHSYGEYVFDHGWADAYERAGGQYYPKLQIGVPFTPVTGPRLMIRSDIPASGNLALAHAAKLTMQETGASSTHITFLTETDALKLESAGWLTRLGVQFHWENKGYDIFDDFLVNLSSRKRKAIRKEREAVTASGVRLHCLTGDDLKTEHWDAFYRFYRNTSDRKWGSPYLTRDFFERLGSTMADRVLLIMAEDHGAWVAGALNLIGTDTLYGRNWGTTAGHPFLHFEACYYQAIEFAITRKLKQVEAGAQGQHKIQRGYLPRLTYSSHWIADPHFRNAVSRFLEKERTLVTQQALELLTESPFRSGVLC